MGRSETPRKRDPLATTTFVALLRGVNVGSANRLSAGAARAAFEAAGAVAVETLLQSGNVVFDARADEGEALAARARATLARACGVDAPIVLREAAAWRRAVAGNPFLAAGADPATLHLACLSAAPNAERLTLLDPDRSPPDAFVVVGPDVYLSLPNGAARSRLTAAWLDARLGVVSTMRNWRTVIKLAAMVAARR